MKIKFITCKMTDREHGNQKTQIVELAVLFIIQN